MPLAIWHGSGARTASVSWNRIEDRLFRGAEVATIYVSFQQVPLVEFPSIFCVAPQEDEQTGNDSKIENFRQVSFIYVAPESQKAPVFRNGGSIYYKYL